MTTMTATDADLRKKHEEHEKVRLSKVRRNRKLLILLPFIILLKILLIKPIWEGIKYLPTIINLKNVLIFAGVIFAIYFGYKLFRKVMGEKKSGLANIVLIWVFDIIIRLCITTLLIWLVSYTIMKIIPFSYTYAWIFWGIPGVSLFVSIIWMTIRSFWNSITHDTVKTDSMGQLMMGDEYPIPFIGNNLSSFPIPLLPFFSVKSVSTAPTNIPISKSTDTNSRPNSLQISLKENAAATKRRPFFIEVHGMTTVDDTLEELKNHLSPDVQGNFFVRALTPRLQAHTFEELLKKDATEDGKRSGMKVSILESIVEEAWVEINAQLKPGGRKIYNLNVIDPVEPNEVLAERNKQAQNEINTAGLNAAAQSILDAANDPNLTFDQARLMASSDEGLVKRTETRFVVPPAAKGKGKKGSQSDQPAPPINIVFNPNDHTHDPDGD